jgi:hypothetical protein
MRLVGSQCLLDHAAMGPPWRVPIEGCSVRMGGFAVEGRGGRDWACVS